MIVKTPTKRQRFLGLVFVLFLVMVLVAVFNKDGVLTVYEVEEELVDLKRKNQALDSENRVLDKEIAALKSQPYSIEKLAREKLNLVKPNETVYQIVRHGPKLPSSPQALRNN